MKAIICDRCGALEKDAKQTSNVRIEFGTNWEQRDFCQACFSALIGMFTENIKVQPHKIASESADHMEAIPEKAASQTACLECGKLFVPDRKDSIYCSKKCRQRVYFRKWYAKKNGTDTETLLQKMKAENPIKEVKRPVHYHEMM